VVWSKDSPSFLHAGKGIRYGSTKMERNYVDAHALLKLYVRLCDGEDGIFDVTFVVGQKVARFESGW